MNFKNPNSTYLLFMTLSTLNNFSELSSTVDEWMVWFSILREYLKCVYCCMRMGTKRVSEQLKLYE